MTDNEIIMALRIYPSMKIIVNNNVGYVITVQDILDIINRQKAEIEELKVEIERLNVDKEFREKLLELSKPLIKAYHQLCCDEAVKERTRELKAEIDELTYKLECLLCHATGSKLSKASYTLRTMEQAVTDYINDCCYETEAEIKSEAIKEFAERLKEMDGYNNYIFDDCASILVLKEYVKGRDEKIKEMLNTIDKLVKEMTEG